MKQKITCGQVWGGIHGTDIDVETCGIRASLFSSACQGGKGGDIYYFSVCGGDMLTRIAIADVVGHGEAVSDTSKWLYHSMVDSMNSINGNEILIELNNKAVDKGFKAITTASINGFYRSKKDLMFASAGHSPILMRFDNRSNWEEAELPNSRGANLPLGVNKETVFEQSSLPLPSKAQLFAYTDGIIEARNSRGEFYGKDRLRDILDSTNGCPMTVKTRILDDLTQFTNGALDHDDITFMSIETILD